VAGGWLTAALVIAQAGLIAVAVSTAVEHRRADLEVVLGALAAVLVGRAGLAWASELVAHRSSAAVTSEIRRSTLGHVADLGPGSLEGRDSGRLAVLTTTGLDGLDVYFARYLPQLCLAVIVPLTVVIAVAGVDWISAVIVVVTVPLIPLFMGLVGASTRARTAARLHSLHRLAGHFLDVVAGLPTLKVFGRAKAQAALIARTTDRYRSTTMAVLRLTFLSSLILELVATVSVALVAVAVGLRLLGGHISFRAALFVLVLAPEAYLPLRSLGANWHAGADGARAAEEAFALADQATGGATPGAPNVPPRPNRDATIEIAGLGVTYPGRDTPALRDLDLVVAPGETVAIVGPSGSGKSTLLAVLLGLRSPSTGSVRVGGIDLADLDLDRWRSQIAWVPQRPHLFSWSVADNVRLGRRQASDDEVGAALRAAALGPVVDRLADGADTVLGEGGAGLSVGERRRLALARAFVRDAPVLLLDEPTAGLDAGTEAAVVDTLRRLVRGRTAVIVSHRAAVVALADRAVVLEPGVVAA
jgi:thiol reductant ABC exporter CydD subunit